MKKTIKHALSVLLASLLLFSAAIIPISAVEPEPTLTIDSMPTNTSYPLEFVSDIDFAGLVVTITEGSFSKQLTYPEDGWYEDENEYYYFECGFPYYEWSDELDDFVENPMVAGDNEWFIQVSYWDYSTGNSYYAETTITMTAYSVLTDEAKAAAPALTIGTPASVALKTTDQFTLLKFTPAESGYYTFSSLQGTDEFDPNAELYDSNSRFVAFGDDERDFNFRFAAKLTAGETYYLIAREYWHKLSGSYSVIVDKMPPLPAGTFKATLNYHEPLDLPALLDTAWNIDDLAFTDTDLLGSDCRGTYGNKRGTETITVTAPDGSSCKLELTVNYTTEQWLCTIFLGGFIWMPYTSIGPFNLFHEIRTLFDYGIGRALFDLLGDWGIPYALRSWLLG